MGTRTFEEMYKGVPPWEIDGPQAVGLNTLYSWFKKSRLRQGEH